MAARVGPVVLIVGVLLAVAALFGPWWMFSINTAGFQVNSNWGLFGASATIREGSQVDTETLSYAQSPSVGSVMMTGAIMVIVALVLGLVAAALSFVAASRPGLRKVGPLAGIGGAALVILSPLYVMNALPGALIADAEPDSAPFFSGFWGSVSESGGTASWGGGFGWYLALLAGIVLLVGSVLALRARAPVGPPARYAPYAYPGYGPAPAQPPAPGAYAPPPAPTQAPAAPPQEAPPPAPVVPPAPAPAAAAAPPPSTGFCQSCGARLPGPVKFCAACGAPQGPPR